MTLEELSSALPADTTASFAVSVTPGRVWSYRWTLDGPRLGTYGNASSLEDAITEILDLLTP